MGGYSEVYAIFGVSKELLPRYGGYSDAKSAFNDFKELLPRYGGYSKSVDILIKAI